MKKQMLNLLMVCIFLLYGIALVQSKAKSSSEPEGPCKAELSDASAGGEVEKADPEDTPTAAIEQLSHDAGRIAQGIELKHTFTIKNVGNADLKIMKARGG